MVQTFLPFPDFQHSIKSLDNRRLGKQRVEANQIYNLIKYLHLLGDLWKIPYRTEYNLKSWIELIINTYNQLSYYIIICNNTLCSAPKLKYKSRITPKAKNPNDIVISLTYGKNPVVRMWFLYPEALQDYTNKCIVEWISRGFKNNMKLFDVPLDYTIPHWLGDSRLHQSHRANLITKEITRKEKSWYTLQSDFINSGVFTEYYWP
jgi:hypothetical protein